MFAKLFELLGVPLGWIMRVCYSLVNNYLIALLLFAIIMQVILLPFSIKQQKNSIRQAKLAPKIAALRKKYAGRNDTATQQKMQMEMQELYKRENFNPASGCLPLLIQMPILLALYQVVINPLRYIGGMAVEKISELSTYLTSAPDAGGLGLTLAGNGDIAIMNKARELLESEPKILEIAPDIEKAFVNVDLFGIDLSLVPTLSVDPFDWLILIPIFTVVFQFLSQKITRMFTYQSPETQEAQQGCSMRVMNWSMPLLSGYIALVVPAAIGIYWIFRGIIMAVQQIILSKVYPTPRFTEEDYKAAEKEMKAGKPVREKSKIPPKSLHRIDDEEYQKEYQRRLAEAEAEEAAERAERAKKDGVDVKMKDDAPVLKDENRHEDK